MMSELSRQLENIRRLPDVASVELRRAPKHIVVTTGPIRRKPYRWKYRFVVEYKYTIRISMDRPSGIRITAKPATRLDWLLNKLFFLSAWPHHHISRNGGDICLGSLDRTMSQSIYNKHYDIAVNLVLQFIKYDRPHGDMLDEFGEPTDSYG